MTEPTCWRGVPGFLRGFGVVVTTLGLIGCATLIALEEYWARPRLLDDAAVFREGTIGTELAPVVVLEVLPDLFSNGVDYFQPLGPAGGDWIDQFGLIRRSDSPLPVGMYQSSLRPQSGTGSPIAFVGLACAFCHSSEIRVTPDGPATVFVGAGTPHADILAFSDAVRGALTAKDEHGKYRLTTESVSRALAKKRGRGLMPAERVVVSLWISAARSEEAESAAMIDDPVRADQLFDPQFIAAGPSRTQPFRSLVRVVLKRPGASGDRAAPDAGFSKIPAVYHQAPEYHGDWAQFDGSVRNPVARSLLAAMTAGGTPDSQARRQIADNTKAAARHTMHLAPPKWTDVPALAAHPIDDELRKLGGAVYRTECLRCHGDSAPDGKWVRGTEGWFGTIRDVGTDEERRRFRHREEIPRVVHAMYASYPRPHPLAFELDDLRAPAEPGYYCGPIGGTFVRAPFLHNGSVPTLAELIGLKPRRATFFRGRNLFDPNDVGLAAPPNGICATTSSSGPTSAATRTAATTTQRGRGTRWTKKPRGPGASTRSRLGTCGRYWNT